MNKKTPVQKAVLKTLSGKKLSSTDSLKKTVSEAISSEYEAKNKADYAITRSIKNLTEAGLIEVFKSDHHEYLRLTPDGKQKVHNITLESENGLVSNVWDGYWRIIILDVPEDRKSERESLRYLLKKAGFMCVKNAVWISMYPFEHLFTNIKNDLGLTTEMIILVTDKLDKESEKTFFEMVKK